MPACLSAAAQPDIFRALAQPTRRRVTELVHARGEISPVMAVAADDRWKQSTMSYHSRTLTRLGLLWISRTRRRRGATEHFYVKVDLRPADEH